MAISPLMAWLRVPDSGAGEKALAGAVALTFFCLPLGTAPPVIAGGLSTAIWIFSGIALAKRRIYLSRYWWPVYALFLLPWIGLLYTPDTTGLAMDYARKTYYWLFGLSVAGIAFVHFPAIRLVQAFLLGLGINAVAAAAQMAFHLPDKNNAHRAFGPDYSTLSAYLIVGIMMSFFFLSRERRTTMRIALLGLAGLYFFHLVVLQSRASYVAFLLLIPLIGLTTFKRAKWLKTVTICLLVPGLMLLSPVVRDRIGLTISQFRYHLRTDDAKAWGRVYSRQQDRLYMWNRALKIIAEHPLVGVGTGGYQTVVKAAETNPRVPLIAHPHNNFLYMAVSFGLMGLGVFAWFLITAVIDGWRHRHTTQGYMLLAVVLVMVTTGLFNTQILDMGTAFLLSLAIGLQQSFSLGDAHG